MKQKMVVYAGCLAVAISTMGGAMAQSPTGLLTLYFHEHTGVGSSIVVDIGGSSYETGPITYTLDPRFPLNSYETFDFETMTVREEADLIITAPLFDTQGIEPVMVHVTETGTFSLSPTQPQPGEDYTILSVLSGTLIVPPDSIFGGWQWANNTEQTTEIETPFFKFRKHKRSEGTATTPSGVQHAMVFEGDGLLAIDPVPEPSALLALSSGVVGLIGLGMRRCRA